jgi:hypothetical protein
MPPTAVANQTMYRLDPVPEADLGVMNEAVERGHGGEVGP